MSILPYALGAAALLSVSLLLAGDGSGPAFRGPCGTGSKVRVDQQERICALGKIVEGFGTLPGFAAFLIPTAYIESRFLPTAGSSAVNNAARGWFGLRPESAFNFRNDLTHLQQTPNLLKDPRWAVAMAADYTFRLIRFTVPASRRGEVTWEDIRRGWALPTNTDPTERGRHPANRKQFLDAIHHTGTDLALATARAPLNNWPGLPAILDAFEI